jgi:hypothetical protein
MSEHARKIRHKAMPEWAEGLYYNNGMLTSSGIIRKGSRPPKWGVLRALRSVGQSTIKAGTP